MLTKLYAILAILRGKNSTSTPVSTISAQMNELRPLPIGATEFEEWSDRIISGALLPADPESQKFALANEILSLGPTVDHKEDIFFIKVLRKFAVNQVADAKRTEIRDRVKAKLAAEAAAKEASANANAQPTLSPQPTEATTTDKANVDEVLGN